MSKALEIYSNSTATGANQKTISLVNGDNDLGNTFTGNSSISAQASKVIVDNLTNNGNFGVTTTSGDIQIDNSQIVNTASETELPNGKLTLSTTGGNISMTNNDVYQADITNSTGNTTINGLDVSGYLVNVKNGSGAVDIAGINHTNNGVGELCITNDSGNIDINNSNGYFQIASDGGNITMDNLTTTGIQVTGKDLTQLSYTPGDVTIKNSQNNTNPNVNLFDTTIYSNGNVTIKDNNMNGNFNIASQGNNTKTVNLVDNTFTGTTSITATDSNVAISGLNNTGDVSATTINGEIAVNDSNISNKLNLNSNGGNLYLFNTSAPQSQITTSARAEITGNGTGNITVIADTLQVATAANSRNYTFQFNTIRDNVTKTVLPSEELSYDEANGVVGYNLVKQGLTREAGTTFMDIPQPVNPTPTPDAKANSTVVDSAATTRVADTNVLENQTTGNTQQFDCVVEDNGDGSMLIRYEKKR